MSNRYGEDYAPKPFEQNFPGEGTPAEPTTPAQVFAIGDVIIEKKLTFEEASRCLNTLGKDESGIRYAYLMITATDRKLTDVSIILNFKHVLFLDLSNNFLTLDSLQVLTQMPFLILLKAERNRVESAALNPMPYLQVLVLNKNQITETCDINQPLLDCLELHNNLIFTAQFDVERLENLKQLELRGNQLLDISGTYPTKVEKLYLPANHITKIDSFDLSKLNKLKILHLRDNNIRKLDGFTEHLTKLEYLNLRDNKINKMRQFRKLKCLLNLETLIITGNPVMGETTKPIKPEDDEVVGEDVKSLDPIRIFILVLLPNLKRLNKEMVTLEERDEALATKDERLEEIMGELSSEDETEPPTTTEITTEYTTETELEKDSLDVLPPPLKLDMESYEEATDEEEY